MSVDARGINPVEEPFAAHADLVADDIGKPVKISSNDTVNLATDGDEFVGILRQLNTTNDIATVQIGGTAYDLDYGDDSPALGNQPVVANGAGGVKVATGEGIEAYTYRWIRKIDSSAGTLNLTL